ncbi:hypothetical protein LPB260_17905 [Pseudomonas sp. LPB0260]|uniref:hypothetical protein n=1 Tax=Pseudomonas sp. LPB0260 TaxID=2614442 RepID=UPI0015C26AD7|nr:hypothetical protein [Pseudomonas sp. LPB0260]QLC72639.1 hypothetical protein LPB260_02955 [Pseudomonas sp. LPB0260]QLC75413.1 hypothetical protein LPB260_17905 [Pseudomonas sp. LPB0260]
MTAPHQGATSSQHAIQQIPVSLQRDFITVVGASHMTLMERLRGQKGNKMRFINQGIRQVRLYPPASANDATQRIFLIFTEDYERPLLDAVKEVVETRYGAKYRELDSIAHLLDFINLRISKKREIKQLDLFAHGLVGTIEFGYELGKADSYRMRDAQAQMLKPEAFDLSGKIYSYACRTGLGIHADVHVSEGEDPQYAKSLAQLIANTAQTPVWAFPRRSNYDQTYGNTSDRAGLQSAQQRVQADKRAMDRYELQLSQYRKRLAAHRKASNDPNAQLPDERMPNPPIKTASTEDETLARHAKSRDTNDQTIGYPLDAEGAVRPVRAGDSPTGVPATLREYKPL